MSKKPRRLTAQEILVGDFSRYSISAGGTFHPLQWGNGREPADMVITIGRSLLLFNMTTSKSYLDDMIQHNLHQALDRVVEWSLGNRPIRGRNEAKSFAIDWQDIDHIFVVCVVDGPHARCCVVDIPGDRPTPKVRVAVALTTPFLQSFAQLRGGARDLLHFSQMRLTRTAIRTADAVSLLRAHHEFIRARTGNVGLPEPTTLGRAVIHGTPVSWFDYLSGVLMGPRQKTDEVLGLLSDFSWIEIFPAISFIITSAREMAPLPGGQIRSAPIGVVARLFIIVSTNMEELNKNTEMLLGMAKEAGCSMTYQMSITHIGQLGMFMLHSPPQVWAIDRELAALVRS